MKSLTGSWVFEDIDGGGTRATYGLVADPGRMLGLLLRGPVEGKVKELLTKSAAEGLKEEAESARSIHPVYEHMFDAGDDEEVLSLREAEAGRRVRLEGTGQGSARQLLPAMPLGLRQGALPGEQAAVHRSGSDRKRRFYENGPST